jgi:hypothetical protein
MPRAATARLTKACHNYKPRHSASAACARSSQAGSFLILIRQQTMSPRSAMRILSPAWINNGPR